MQNKFLLNYYTDKIYTLAEQKNLTPTEIVREIVQGWLSEDRNLMTSLQGQLTDQAALLKSIQEEVIKVKMLDKKFTIGMWAVNSKVHQNVFKELDLNEDPRCLFSNEGIFTK